MSTRFRTNLLCFARGNLYKKQTSFIVCSPVAAAGLATYLTVRQVQHSHGTLAGVVFLTVSYFFVRFYIGASMSEVLGYSLGLAGIFLLTWVYAPLQMLPQQTGIVKVCSHDKVKPIHLVNDYFFYADSITPVASKTK